MIKNYVGIIKELLDEYNVIIGENKVNLRLDENSDVIIIYGNGKVFKLEESQEVNEVLETLFKIPDIIKEEENKYF